MIADVIGNYIDSLGERDFDAPFMALIRALRFRNVHYLHGPFEFGKDFIAQKDIDGVTTQFAFQTKAGDIGSPEWRTSRGQIDMLRTNSLAHPAFNRALPRRAVFVTTGRLVGAAALDAQEYVAHLSQLPEIGFETWDREKLVELITDTPEVGLTSKCTGALLELIGQIDEGKIDERRLAHYSERWLLDDPSTLNSAALETAVLVSRLRSRNRIDLACFLPLCLIRAAWETGHGLDPPEAPCTLTADLGRDLFERNASDLFQLCGREVLDPMAFVRTQDLMAVHVTYPVRCSRLVEILGLLGLLIKTNTGIEDERLAQYLADFVESHPGAAHPTSDRWAVSLIPPVMMLCNSGRKNLARQLLLGVAKWIADRYDNDGPGLAGPDASPDVEIEFLLGGAFEHVEIERRSESFLASVVLDLASIASMGDLFATARNEFLAVELHPSVVEAPDTKSQYVRRGAGMAYTANMEYADSWRPVAGWKVSPHHERAAEHYLQRIGRTWDLLAVSAVLRDRYFLEACRSGLSVPA